MATCTNKELSETKAMMKHLAASFTAQEATVTTLSTNMNGGSSGAWGVNRQEERETRLACVRTLQAQSIPQGWELVGVGGE